MQFVQHIVELGPSLDPAAPYHVIEQFFPGFAVFKQGLINRLVPEHVSIKAVHYFKGRVHVEFETEPL